MNSEDELDIRQYFTLLRKRSWLLVTITAVCIVVAGAYSFAQPKIYQASARVVLSTSGDAVASGSALSDPNAFQAQVGTQIQVVKSPDVAAVATKALGPTAPQVRSVSAAGVTNTRIMEISAQSKSATVAANAANAYTNAYISNRAQSALNDVSAITQNVQNSEQSLNSQLSSLNSQLAGNPSNANNIRDQISTINTQIAQLQTQYSTVQAQATVRDSAVELLSQATPPGSPVSPKPLRNMAVAAVLGLLLGIGLVLLLERLDDRIRTEEDLQRFAPGLDQLASIPKVEDWKDEAEAKTVTLVEPQSPAAEAYRRLRTSIEFVALDTPMQVIEITSATAGEGKSTTVANLATALAWSGKRVVIVAADLRRPRVHDFFGVSNAEGFTSVLLSGDDISSVLQTTNVHEGSGTVQVLATGPLPPNPTELLSSQRVKDLFAILRRHADYILVDSPPVLPVADPLVLSNYADGIVLVAGADKLHRRQFDRSMSLMAQAQAPVVGVVLNGTTARASYYRYDQYYYGSHIAGATTGESPSDQAEQTIDLRGSRWGKSRKATGATKEASVTESDDKLEV